MELLARSDDSIELFRTDTALKAQYLAYLNLSIDDHVQQLRK